jgi:hypothetical protein
MTNRSVKRQFSNHRRWREFIAAIHETPTFPCSVSLARRADLPRWQTSANWLSVGENIGVRESQPAAMRVDVAVSLA